MMSMRRTLTIPEVTDDDIAWVSRLLHLGELDQARKRFLRERHTVDVPACPGSGKTTLIVAKLAILARRWPTKAQGICVLSHTNAAREEIQRRLGDTPSGHRLLEFPHFIGTLHGFANRFLAIPWLVSNGRPPPLVDDGIAYRVRRAALSPRQFSRLESFLARKRLDLRQVRITSRDLNFAVEGRPFPAKPETASYQSTMHALRESYEKSVFCHDEMFVWANALIKDFHEAVRGLRLRFPLVLVDEMQDTSALQNALLQAVFPRDNPDIAIQRVGDPNQAIYGPGQSSSEEGVHDFPDANKTIALESSFRFGPSIAKLAEPFAISPVCLSGAGIETHRAHAIFVFPESSTDGVLDAFGEHVLSAFDDEALGEGIVAAVGSVHKDAPDVGPGHKKYPQTVSHYWRDYRPEHSRRETRPSTLIQHFRLAQSLALDRRDVAEGLQMLVSGLNRLLRILDDRKDAYRRDVSHRAICETLASDAAASDYRRMLVSSLVDRDVIDESAWRRTCHDLQGIASRLLLRDIDLGVASDFLAWVPGVAGSAGTPVRKPVLANTYTAAAGGRSVHIRLSSIHAVKGQTHLATLVLSTYFKEHSAARLLPWLLGEKRGIQGRVGIEDRRRLRETFVAVSRPSQLLCLAIPRFVLGDSDGARERALMTLSERGWRVSELVNGKAVWRE